MSKKTLNEYAENFGNNIKLGIESIKQAATEYADAIREYPSKAEKYFREQFPSVTATTWDKLRSIGNGDLNPNAILVSDVFCKALSKLPIEKQNRIFIGKGFRVVDPITRQTSVVAFSQLTARQEKIVFDGESIRTPEQQRKYIDDTRSEMEENNKIVPYHIDGKRLFIHRKCEIGLRELEKIIEKMK